MSKAVLISIRPKWCEKIINGQKTIEVRKTRPKMDTPFKCYIYKCGNGKVIGEFLCDEIIEDRTYGHHDELNPLERAAVDRVMGPVSKGAARMQHGIQRHEDELDTIQQAAIDRMLAEN